MPARDVVAKAKAAGLTFSEKYVYNVRGASRSSSKKKSTKGTGGNGNASPAKATPAAPQGHNSEASFRKMVVELGLDRAKRLLADVETKLRSLISGT